MNQAFKEKEFDPTRGFCCGDLIYFSAATVCRSLSEPSGVTGRPQGEKDLSNEPARLAVWLGLVTYEERCMSPSYEGWKLVYTGEVRHHLYHMLLASCGILYVHETPLRRPGMKLVDAVAV
jgi:hypothetical protein